MYEWRGGRERKGKRRAQRTAHKREEWKGVRVRGEGMERRGREEPTVCV